MANEGNLPKIRSQIERNERKINKAITAFTTYAAEAEVHVDENLLTVPTDEAEYALGEASSCAERYAALVEQLYDVAFAPESTDRALQAEAEAHYDKRIELEYWIRRIPLIIARRSKPANEQTEHQIRGANSAHLTQCQIVASQANQQDQAVAIEAGQQDQLTQGQTAVEQTYQISQLTQGQAVVSPTNEQVSLEQDQVLSQNGQQRTPESFLRISGSEAVSASQTAECAAQQGTSDGQCDVNRALLDLLTRALNPNSAPRQSTETVKLPKYELPKFSGKPEEWSSFWDQFEKAVASKSSLGNVEKMQYLLRCVKGDAEKLVKGLPLTNENYGVAVSLLKDKFGNPQVAIEQIYRNLIDLKSVPPRDCRKLREFVFDLESQLRRLEALGADAQSDHLVGVVLRKVPRTLVSQMERTKGSKKQWSMQLLRELLGEELEVQEATYGRCEKDQQQEVLEKDRRKAVDRKGTTDSFAGTDCARYRHKPTGPVDLKCFYCGGKHWTDDCKTVTTVNDRKAFIRRARRCFVCLSEKHTAKNCNSERPCYHCKKVRLHHRSTCPARESIHKQIQDESGKRATDDTVDLTNDDEEFSGLASDEHAVMKTALCEAVNPDDGQKAERVRVFLDTGTSRSYVTRDLAKRLKLKTGRKQRLLVNRFADDGQPKSIEMQEAKLTLRTAEGKQYKIFVSVTDKALGNITLTQKSQIRRHVPKELKLADEILNRNQKVAIDIMIGNDYYDDLVHCERKQIKPGLWLIDSAFGWLVSGRMSDGHSDVKEESGMFVLSHEHSRATLDVDPDQIKRLQLDDLWNLERIGIQDEPNDVTDDVAIENFHKTVKVKDGRYEVTWPWKANVTYLPRNDDIAEKRLTSMITRLQRRKKIDFLEKYDAVIRDQLKQGVIEQVEDDKDGNRCHYLSHHAVEKADSTTTKLRVVYNASYRRPPDHPSLNDCLFRGQVFLEDIVVLLIRFRQHKVAIVGDLEKAFLKIGLQDAERDVTRFYWIKDVNKPPDKDNLLTYRFTRVAFGVKSSPFLLGATVAYHLKQHGSEIAEQIARDLYVDNLVTGTDSTANAVELYKESKRIFQAGSMNIREFGSNDTEFTETVTEPDRANRNPVKVLGMQWNMQTDKLALRCPEIQHDVTWTKKRVLSTLFQIYDPLGLVSPATLPGKVLLQQMNKEHVHWDEKLPSKFTVKWQQIRDDLRAISEVSIDRSIKSKIEECGMLMVFCDASAEAYGTAVYLVDPRKNSSHLIFAKARVSPIKKMTIPRLELLAVTLGVRLAEFLRAKLPYTGTVVVWTDSQCVLRWISDQSVTGVFVENRLREIRRAKKLKFRYVPTAENPADVASRGCKAGELPPVWWKGPSWLTKDETEWPKWEGNVESLKLTNDRTEEEAMKIDSENVQETPFGINPANFSKFGRLIRVTAYCFRFLRAMRSKTTTNSEKLEPEEIREATIAWLKWSQLTDYPRVLIATQLRQKDCLQQQLGLKVDKDGLLRCHGRLANMEVDDETKYPVLLPSKGKITELIIEKYHEQNMHTGESQTLAAIRRQFWIPKGRTRVKTVISKCLRCKIYDGKSFRRPEMPELPKCRTTQMKPFTETGLDYFGPLYVKADRADDEKAKRWVCLFTCLTTRAIHLEMVQNMTADEFLLALRRFVARRNKPATIVCDNATQFQVVYNIDPLSKTLAGEPIKWKFIPVLSPWAGGIYERLVRSVKSAMRKTIGRQLLTETQLQTILTETENVVNSRPLTYVGDDVNSWSVLTPNDFLNITSEMTIPQGRKETDEDYIDGQNGAAQKLRKMHRRQRNTMEQLWSVWQKDYLLSLREKLRYRHKDGRSAVTRAPVLGEVVVIREEATSRGRWKLGRVEELKLSTDGKARAALVRTPGGGKIMRPVNFLFPIECSQALNLPMNERSSQGETETKQHNQKEQVRNAARDANKKMKAIIQCEDVDFEDQE